MPQVAKAARKERAARLRALGDARAAAYLDSRIGRAERVLVETPGTGRAESFAEVAFTTPRAETGRVVAATALGVEAGRLLAA
jgi:threonylcarbamoyladenosine tRNA methylthiotransferase MtaB